MFVLTVPFEISGIFIVNSTPVVIVSLVWNLNEDVWEIVWLILVISFVGELPRLVNLIG